MESNADINPWGCLHLIIYFLIMLILGFILALFGSCRSVQYVPVETIKHDSIYINKHDTIKFTKIKTEKEYVYEKDSSSVVLDEQGKILKNEIWHNKLIIKEKNDSLNYYKALTDSLYAVKQKTEQVPVVVEKELTKWQKRFITIGKVSTGIGIGLLIVGLIWFIIWIKRKLGK